MTSIYEALNPQQQKGVLTTEGPVLILAGAGSGKTRVLTHRIAYLIEECRVNPYQILAITFTNKAAGEMRDRVNNLVEACGEQVWVSTFHSLCVRILRRYIDQIGYDNHFTIYDADDQKTVMKNVCKTLDVDTKVHKEKTLLKAISSAKDELIDVDEFEIEAGADYNKQIQAKVYREYQDALQRSNALDFDDIIVKTVELFKKCPQVLDGYQERFLYIMVDEYQDTNTAQLELVRLLSAKYRNLCVVGDDDQSIYRFRGANIRNILDFEHYFPEATVIKLEQNYRSTATILQVANAVIGNNSARKDKSLWTSREDGEKVHFRQFETGYDEASFIARDIKKQGSQLGYKNIAVLYRTNAQSRVIEEKMIMEGIPYNVVGGTNFYARAEIKDILAYLKTIDNGNDEVALRRIINVPKRGIGGASLDKIADYAELHDITLFQALEQADDIMGLGRAVAKIRPFVDLIRQFRDLSMELTVAELIEQLIEKIDYKKYLEDNDEESADDRIENVEELISKAVAYREAAEEDDLTDFLEEVALVADIDKLSDNDEKVLLMTLHSAKGLEFSHVYLAGMEDGLFPSSMSILSNDMAEMEEERRLAYVGITRAMDVLTISCAKTRMQRGEIQYHPVSRFVREIPEDLLDEGIAKPRRAPEPTPVMEIPKHFISPLMTMKMQTQTGKLEEPDYKVGDRVRHTKFGEGTVLDMVKETKDYKVTVMFDTCGQKIMYAFFAKLKRV